MKRASLGGLVALSVIVTAMLAACSSSPKAQVSDFLALMPASVGEWELDEGATVELKNSTITSQGHAALTYEGPGDELAFIVVEAYPSEDAAEVAFAARERELLLENDLELQTSPGVRQATAYLTQDDRVRYAFFLEGVVMVEIDALTPESDALVSDELFDAMLDIVRQVYARLEED